MIDLLLSDRADERRSLFEEAAGIGLYRDRKHSTERRLEETAVDLQRVEDLIAEVQSQIRSLARQRGKAERHAKLTEERFAVQITLARRLLERLTEDVAGMETALRRADATAPRRADAGWPTPSTGARTVSRSRSAAEGQRTEIARRLGERAGRARQARRRSRRSRPSGSPTLTPAGCGRRRSAAQAQLRAQQASGEQEAATADRGAAGGEHERIRAELAGRGKRRGGRASPARPSSVAWSASGSRSCSNRPRPSGRWRVSGPRWKASSPRCASGSPRPRPTGPRFRSSSPTPSAGAITPSSGPAS